MNPIGIVTGWCRDNAYSTDCIAVTEAHVVRASGVSADAPLVDHAYAGLADAFIGMVDTSTMPLKHEITKKKPAAAAGVDLDGPLAPPLAAVLNLHDIEAIAQRCSAVQ